MTGTISASLCGAAGHTPALASVLKRLERSDFVVGERVFRFMIMARNVWQDGVSGSKQELRQDTGARGLDTAARAVTSPVGTQHNVRARRRQALELSDPAAEAPFSQRQPLGKNGVIGNDRPLAPDEVELSGGQAMQPEKVVEAMRGGEFLQPVKGVEKRVNFSKPNRLGAALEAHIQSVALRGPKVQEVDTQGINGNGAQDGQKRGPLVSGGLLYARNLLAPVRFT